jgi:hypothetical protein
MLFVVVVLPFFEARMTGVKFSSQAQNALTFSHVHVLTTVCATASLNSTDARDSSVQRPRSPTKQPHAIRVAVSTWELRK